MFNCRGISELTSLGRDKPLSFWQRVRVQFHLSYCFLCRRFARQLETIGQFSRAAGGDESLRLLAEGGVVQESLSADARTRMKKKLSGLNPKG